MSWRFLCYLIGIVLIILFFRQDSFLGGVLFIGFHILILGEKYLGSEGAGRIITIAILVLFFVAVLSFEQKILLKYIDQQVTHCGMVITNKSTTSRKSFSKTYYMTVRFDNGLLESFSETSKLRGVEGNRVCISYLPKNTSIIFNRNRIYEIREDYRN